MRIGKLSLLICLLFLFISIDCPGAFFVRFNNVITVQLTVHTGIILTKRIFLCILDSPVCKQHGVQPTTGCKVLSQGVF